MEPPAATGALRNVTSFQLLAGAVLTFFLVFVGRAIYNIFFHPLAKWPGPKLYAATGFPITKASVLGQVPFEKTKLHEKYGHVVRTGPNELSFSSAQAWPDIYGLRTGNGQMPKYGGPETNAEGFGRLNMVNATIDDHSRYRRLVAHAFSDRAMREQEPLLKEYVDLLIEKLHERADQKIDITAWLNFTTFDLMGNLLFSESFDCLNKGEYHPWISMIFNNLKLMVYGNAARKVPGLTKLLMAMTPKKIIEEGQAHMELAKEQTNKRLAMKTDRNDIMSYIIRHNGKETGMSLLETQAQSYVIIIGGSETTATLLSGAIYYLCKNPSTMQKLQDEIRSSFKSEADINFNSVSGLKYMLAVLNESLRIYPPVPGTLPRAVPTGGATIDGQYVPGGTEVGVCQWAANHSALNFRDPEVFAPERWLGDARYVDDNREACQPFSFGPRNCVGKNLAYMEMRLILARIVWNFDMSVCEESSGWARQRVFILWEKPPLMVRMTRRKM